MDRLPVPVGKQRSPTQQAVEPEAKGLPSITLRAVLRRLPPATGSASMEPYGAVARYEVRSLVHDQRLERCHSGHSSLKCQVTGLAQLQSAVAPACNDSAIGVLANSATLTEPSGAVERHEENILVLNRRQGGRISHCSDLERPAPESTAIGEPANSPGLPDQPVGRHSVKERRTTEHAQPHSTVAPARDDTAIGRSANSVAPSEPRRGLELHEDNILVPNQCQEGRVIGRPGLEHRATGVVRPLSPVKPAPDYTEGNGLATTPVPADPHKVEHLGCERRNTSRSSRCFSSKCQPTGDKRRRSPVVPTEPQGAPE
jgi:hypothetical protein